jgi:hypothetical protein
MKSYNAERRFRRGNLINLLIVLLVVIAVNRFRSSLSPRIRDTSDAYLYKQPSSIKPEVDCDDEDKIHNRRPSNRHSKVISEVPPKVRKASVSPMDIKVISPQKKIADHPDLKNV